MRKVLIMVVSVLTILFQSSVYADTEKMLNSDIAEKEIISQVGLISNKQSVIVKRTIQGKTTTIYDGDLSGFDNGAWTFLDFSNTDAFIIFDWELGDNATLCILNKDAFLNENINSINNNRETTTENINNNASYIISDVNLKNEFGELVNSLQYANVIDTAMIVKNSNGIDNAVLFAAIYDDEKLVEVKKLEMMDSHEQNDMVQYNINLPLNNLDENSSVKLMIWDGGTLKPYSLAVELFYDYGINISVSKDEIYSFPITSNIESQTYTINYDSEYFEIYDLCKETEHAECTTGNINENLTINSVSEGRIVLTFSENEELINTIELKAISSGNTRVGILGEEISEVSTNE